MTEALHTPVTSVWYYFYPPLRSGLRGRTEENANVVQMSYLTEAAAYLEVCTVYLFFGNPNPIGTKAWSAGVFTLPMSATVSAQSAHTSHHEPPLR